MTRKKAKQRNGTEIPRMKAQLFAWNAHQKLLTRASEASTCRTPPHFIPSWQVVKWRKTRGDAASGGLADKPAVLFSKGMTAALVALYLCAFWRAARLQRCITHSPNKTRFWNYASLNLFWRQRPKRWKRNSEGRHNGINLLKPRGQLSQQQTTLFMKDNCGSFGVRESTKEKHSCLLIGCRDDCLQ